MKVLINQDIFKIHQAGNHEEKNIMDYDWKATASAMKWTDHCLYKQR